MKSSLNFEALYDTCLNILNKNSLIYCATTDNLDIIKHKAFRKQLLPWDSDVS